MKKEEKKSQSCRKLRQSSGNILLSCFSTSRQNLENNQAKLISHPDGDKVTTGAEPELGTKRKRENTKGYAENSCNTTLAGTAMLQSLAVQLTSTWCSEQAQRLAWDGKFESTFPSKMPHKSVSNQNQSRRVVYVHLCGYICHILQKISLFRVTWGGGRKQAVTWFSAKPVRALCEPNKQITL